MKKVPAPIGGLNYLTAENRQSETDAKVLDNWIPDTGFCRIRESETEEVGYITGVGGDLGGGDYDLNTGEGTGDPTGGGPAPNPACIPYACDALATLFGDSTLNGWHPAGTTTAQAFPLSSGMGLSTGTRWEMASDDDLGDGCLEEALVIATNTSLGGDHLVDTSSTANETGPILLSFIAKDHNSGAPAWTSGEIIRADLRGRYQGTFSSGTPTFDVDAGVDWGYFITKNDAGGEIGLVQTATSNHPRAGLVVDDFSGGGDTQLTLGTLDVSDAAGGGTAFGTDWFAVSLVSSVEYEVIERADPTISGRSYFIVAVTYDTVFKIAYFDASRNIIEKSITASKVAYPTFVISNDPTRLVTSATFDWYPTSPSVQQRFYMADGLRNKFAGIYLTDTNPTLSLTTVLRNSQDYTLPSFCT